MGRPKLPSSNQCSCCKHPEREALDSLLQTGVSYRDVARQFPGLAQRTIEHHARTHMVYTRQEVDTRVRELDGQIETSRVYLERAEMPEDLWTWGQELLVEATIDCRSIAQQTGAIRAYEVYLRAIDLVLKVGAENRKNQTANLDDTITVTVALPEE